MIIFFVCFFIYVLSVFIFCIYKVSEKQKIFNIKNKLNYNDDDYINKINILGTHDSLTYSIRNYLSPFAKTQTVDIKTQYNLGSRFFDLRFQKKNNKLTAYHGFINLGFVFEEVFLGFLKIIEEENGFVIISIREENDSDNFNIEKDIYNFFVSQHKEYKVLFNDGTIPQIKDLKNKIYFINIMKKNNFYSFISWPYNTVFNSSDLLVQDVNEAGVKNKINIIGEFLTRSENSIKLNFFSIQTNFFQSIKDLAWSVQTMVHKNNILKDKKGFVFIFDYIEMIYMNGIIADILL